MPPTAVAFESGADSLGGYMWQLDRRIASALSDQTTVERLAAWAQDLRSRLRQILDARRTKQEISKRARELWEQNGRPADRDLEFWLQAEAEIRDRNRE